MPAAEASYAITCTCGTSAHGARIANSQVVLCASCRRSLFVFPLSPLPIDLFGSLATVAGQSSSALKLPDKVAFWVVPTTAAVVALAVVGVVIASIVRNYRPNSNGVLELTSTAATALIAGKFDAARAAVSDGAYRLAKQELDAARASHDRFPEAVDADTRLQLRAWHKQVSLLADLASESIEEIMRHALGQSDREWQAVFRERYANRAIVIDARVFRDAAGRYHVDYQLGTGGLGGDWDVQAYSLFAKIPLQRPQRLIFGMRLAEIARSSRDRWIVRPEPDSGVLFTDETILSGLSIPIDNEIRDVLRRQASWNVDD